MPLRDHQAGQEDGSGAVLAPEQAAGALALPHDQPDRHGNRDQDVGDGESEVSLRPLVDPKSAVRNSYIVKTQRPKIAIRTRDGVRVVEQQPRDRLRERERDRHADRRGPEQ